MGRFIHAGGESFILEYVGPPTLTPAELVDVEEDYAGTPIYVRTAKSEPQEVVYTGSPTISDNDGVKTYAFAGGGSYTPSKIQQIDKQQYEDYGNMQGATSVIRRLVSFGSAVSRPANPTKITQMRFRFPNSIPAGTPVTVSLKNFGYNNVYDCTTWANYYSAPDYDYVGYFASSGSSGGGSVTVKPYTPEIVRAQKLQQGKLTPAQTQPVRYDYYTYVPSNADTETKTVLARSGSTAMQNFAFDMEEDSFE